MDYKKNPDGSWKKNCDYYVLIEFLSKKRVLMILFMISEGEDRFSGLQKKLSQINSKILMERLDELNEKKYIERYILSEKPRRVRYKILQKGEKIVKSLEHLCDGW